MSDRFPRYLPFLGFSTIVVDGGGIYRGHRIELKGLFFKWFGKGVMIHGTATLKDHEPF